MHKKVKSLNTNLTSINISFAIFFSIAVFNQNFILRSSKYILKKSLNFKEEEIMRVEFILKLFEENIF